MFNVQEEVWSPVDENKFDFCMYSFEDSPDIASYTNDDLSFSPPYTPSVYSSTHSILTPPSYSSFSLPNLNPPQHYQNQFTVPVGLSNLSDSMLPIDPCPPTASSLPVFEVMNPLSSHLWMDSFKPNISCNDSTNVAGEFGSLTIDRAPEKSSMELLAASSPVCLPHSIYDPSELQVLAKIQKQVNSGQCSRSENMASAFDDCDFKVGRLSVEEKKEKIHRYKRKRNERNFTKKIKYACRKTLADSRPRVKGRFAKNDEFNDVVQPCCSNHGCQEDRQPKEQDQDTLSSLDLISYTSGVNSFVCSSPIVTWM